MKINKKYFSEEQKAEEGQEVKSEDFLSVMMGEPAKPELRLTGIYGDINEEKCSEAVYGLQAAALGR